VGTNRNGPVVVDAHDRHSLMHGVTRLSWRPSGTTPACRVLFSAANSAGTSTCCGRCCGSVRSSSAYRSRSDGGPQMPEPC